MAVLELLRILHKSHLQMIPALPEFYLWFKLRSRCLIMAENRKLQRTQKTETKTDPKKFPSHFNSGEWRWTVLLPKGLKQIQSNRVILSVLFTWRPSGTFILQEQYWPAG